MTDLPQPCGLRCYTPIKNTNESIREVKIRIIKTDVSYIHRRVIRLLHPVRLHKLVCKVFYMDMASIFEHILTKILSESYRP